MRIEPAVKVGLKAVAEQERRSLANMIEVMIRDYCGRSGIPIDKPSAVPDSTPEFSTRTKKNAGSGLRNRHA